MGFVKTNITDTINGFRSKLYQKLTAPLDAMWEQLYIASSQHYLIEKDNRNIGYCCINDENCLLQIFLLEEYRSEMETVIIQLIDSKLVQSASLSSNEPIAFNICLAHASSIKTNTYCFEHSNQPVIIDAVLNLVLVSRDDIPAIKAFLLDQLGMDDTFGYTENLVSRNEIYMIKETDMIIATSECRMSDTQTEIADLGMIVHRDYQGKGIATQIMKMQVNKVLKAKRKPICSTTLDNIASRKVIEKSGFYCSHIIFDIIFT